MTTPIPAPPFAGPAPAQHLEQAAAALTAHGFTVEILDDAAGWGRSRSARAAEFSQPGRRNPAMGRPRPSGAMRMESPVCGAWTIQLPPT